jgi:hypothetical protein
MRSVLAVRRSPIGATTAWSIGLAISLVLALAGPASADEAAAQLTGRVVDLFDRPVEGANVHVITKGGGARVAKTDRDGRYRIELPDPGAYSVVFGHDGVTAQRSVVVKAGAPAVADGVLELGDGEVIEILDAPPVLPKPIRDPRRVVRYSDEAVLRDAWAKAWILLDVGATGQVSRIKLLKAPGYGLDKIAIEEAFKLRFEPARDRNGRAIATLVVWSLEWPSHGWLLAKARSAARLPREEDNQLGVPALQKAPCAGSGPLELHDVHAVYRDCSRPDLSKVNSLPWVERP